MKKEEIKRRIQNMKDRREDMKVIKEYFKVFFIKTNAYNMVAFVDKENKCFCFGDECFDERLTFEYAKNADYSSIVGCETAEDVKYITGAGDGEIYDFEEIEKYAEKILEF